MVPATRGMVSCICDKSGLLSELTADQKSGRSYHHLVTDSWFIYLDFFVSSFIHFH